MKFLMINFYSNLNTYVLNERLAATHLLICPCDSDMPNFAPARSQEIKIENNNTKYKDDYFQSRVDPGRSPALRPFSLKKKDLHNTPLALAFPLFLFPLFIFLCFPEPIPF